jgi:hypothetical protein
MILQQSPKHLGLVSRFIHWHQVLNLTEGHHPLDPLLWVSILEDSKLSGVLGASGWVVWIHEELHFDPLRLVRVSPINFVHLLHLRNERNGGFSRTEGVNAAEYLENLLMLIVWNGFVQQKYDQRA